MKILITAAEEEELIVAKQAYNSLTAAQQERLESTFLLTGIGSTTTTYRVTKSLNNQESPFDFALNIGIAGSFTQSLPIGSVAQIEREYFGDLGFETFSGFQTLFDYKILDSETHPFRSGGLDAPTLTPQIEQAMANYRKVTAVTVQTVSGLPGRREMLIKEFNPQIESMEGAAFFYTCLLEEIPFMELRSVSNEVGERERSKWNIPLALSSLKEAVQTLLNALAQCDSL